MSDFESLEIPERKIIAGVDLGTTFSGLSFAQTKRPDRHANINQWPVQTGSNEGASSDKVPTVLRYTPTGLQWGFQIPPNAPADEIMECFKLGLDPELAATATDLGSSKSLENADKHVADYLRALKDHLLFVLKEKLGAGIVQSIPIEFVLTVPAIWSEKAQQKTLMACEEAGLGNSASITLVSEPEAAAIYALHGLDPHGLEEGHCFVVCDAGGGTVDLISYIITRLRPILEVKEATVGSGGFCGSSFLNRRFKAFLKRELGKEPNWDEDVLDEALERFESTIKKNFSLSVKEDQPYSVPVPGLADNPALGIKRGRYSLEISDLKKIFEPVIAQVIALVENQIASTNVEVKAVLLVGGFGSSTYLKERLRQALGENVGLMQPSNAWLAVVNGAVMKGLSNSSSALTTVTIKSRASRKHYGTILSVPYQPRIHQDLKDKVYRCSYSGKLCVDAMEWFIKKGDPVSENKPHKTPFYQRNPKSIGKKNFLKWDMEILCDKRSATAPVGRNGNVSVLTNLSADLSCIPDESIEETVGKDGQVYYQVGCHIETVFGSASTKYTLVHEGVRYNSVTAEYVG